MRGRHGGAPAAARTRTQTRRAHLPARRTAVHLAGLEGAQAVDLITIRQLSVSRRIADINLNLVPGEMRGVIDANGAATSTLLQSLGGVLLYRCEIPLNDTLLSQMPER